MLRIDEAEHICQYYDAHLPNPESEEENNFLASLGTTWLTFKQTNKNARMLNQLVWKDSFT